MLLLFLACKVLIFVLDFGRCSIFPTIPGYTCKTAPNLVSFTLYWDESFKKRSMFLQKKNDGQVGSRVGFSGSKTCCKYHMAMSTHYEPATPFLLKQLIN